VGDLIASDADPSAGAPEGEDEEAEERRIELRLEASTMALYVSVVLLATLVALDDSADPTELLGLIWGTTIGLALAHYFAFRMSSRLVRGTTLHRRDLDVASAQLGGAALVAAICTVPVILFPAESEYDVVRLLLALLLGIAGYAAGRSGGASVARSLVSGLTTLVLGIAVALVKNALLGH
jgi:hypothetical protein